MLEYVGLRDVLDVLAVVSPLGNIQGFARGLADPGLHAQCEVADLNAGVVVIELTTDRVPGPLQQRRERIAQRRLAAVAHMQWTSGVG